jgi:hypothetical protein
LLDDDRAGRDGQKRYVTDYLLPEAHVQTLGDIDHQLKGKTFEAIYADDVRSAVIAAFGDAKPKKRQFSLFFQELIATNSKTVFNDTQARYQPVSNWIDRSFGLTSGSKVKRGTARPRADSTKKVS